MKIKYKMADYDYEQAQMRLERKEERRKMTKAEKRAELNRKLDRCTDVHEYIKLLTRLA
jgi:hypothetical protein